MVLCEGEVSWSESGGRCMFSHCRALCKEEEEEEEEEGWMFSHCSALCKVQLLKVQWASTL